ncbi:uncharacterized protein LOC128922612 [Zeugodacus cucurbitae]|uniref:uncharacterized protein LOC128922612 n=1 Tax=Zeugodacus cucurbitae TaxID=28588 RepID=UPI0023D95046|nr:uncharacterized protein LOC128922612 [Zeugodacus cucurbitae]
MKLLEIFCLILLIFLRIIARNEGRTLSPKSDITTKFTEVISESGQINEDKFPQKESNITQDDENRRLKSLMEELLLKRGNDTIVQQLLPPNYNERKFVTDGENTATRLMGDYTNLSNTTNEGNRNAQPEELSTNAAPERWLNRMETMDTAVELSTNETSFDDRNLTLNIRDNNLNSTHNGSNHTTHNSPDVSERHATISLHIYSTREEDGSDDHPIDHLSVDAKHIGSNETLKQQLDFLQKNAENIKMQQHIVGDNGVYIVERGDSTDEAQTGKVDIQISNTSSYHVHLRTSVATSFNKNGIQVSSTYVSPELPMPLVQPTETNGEPVISYVVPNLNSGANTVSKAPGNTNKGDQQTVSLKHEVIAELNSPHSYATQSVYSPSHTPAVLYISSLVSESQEYVIHSVTENHPSNHNSGANYYTLSYETSELPKPQTKPFKQNQPQTSPIESNLSSTEPIMSENKNNSTRFASNENVPQSSELKYNLVYKDPQKANDIFLFEPSEPISYLSASSNTFNIANIDDAFERLTEIFEQYSVPISSVVKQLSDGYESTQENAISPTRSHESEKVPNTQALTKKHERPDTRVDGITYDGPDSVELGYGAGYTILQSQLNFLNFNQTNEVESDENSSHETISEETVKSEEECNVMCTEESEVEVPQPFNQLKQPTTTYQSVESGESNESELQLNDPSATEYNNVNAETTNLAETTETKLSTTKVMTLFDGATEQFATYPIAAIANEPANNLEHLEVAIENDVRKEIENIDKTNETQVATTHQQQQQHQHFAADTELLAENTNDKSTWATAGLQHISQTLLPQPDTTTNVTNAKGERMRVPKPEVMCSKTEIIKSEQYSKTNENGNETENENENENEAPETTAGGRVLLGRSLSYTISCHIRKPEQAAASVPAVQAANITDEIDNNREKIIKNHEQLTITSADDSRNGLPLRHRGTEQQVEAELIERRTEMDSSGNKASDGNADEGVGTADIDVGGYYDAGNDSGDSAEGGTESDENYYTDIDGNVHEIDGDGAVEADADGDVDVYGYVSSAACC